MHTASIGSRTSEVVRASTNDHLEFLGRSVWRRFVTWASVLIAAFGLISGVALANHMEPSKAKKFSFALVNGFFGQCNPSNTATRSGNISACVPPVAAEPSGCALSSEGSGKLSMVVTGDAAMGTQDVKIAASARGLNDFCENHQMCVSLSFRATTDDCPEGSCVTEDIEDYPLFGGCCTVRGGTCRINMTLSAAAPGLFANGQNTGIQIRGCGLQTHPPAGPHEPGLACGILVK